MTEKPQLEFTYRGRLRDFMIGLALVVTGLNLVQCWQGGKEVKELKDKIQAMTAPSYTKMPKYYCGPPCGTGMEKP